MTALRAAVLVCSDRAARGEREDRTVAGLTAVLEAAGHQRGEVRVVADEESGIQQQLRALATDHDLVLTTGGTGIGRRDVTVEATRAVIQKELPGFGEAMRAKSLAATPTAILSRATAGTLDRCLILNLPGSPRGAAECLQAVAPALGHACAVLRREVTDCQEELAP